MDASRVVTVYLVSVVLWTVPGFQSAAVMPPSAQQRRHRGARAPQDAGRSARLLLREMLLASPPVSDRDQDQALRPREDLKDAVVPHDYMVSIYRTYSAAEKLGLNSSFFLSSKSANTITSFVDRGTDDHAPPSPLRRQRYLFDVSSLSDKEELVGAELRVFRRAAQTPQTPGVYDMQLFPCRSSDRPLDSRSLDPLDSRKPGWEVLDVWEMLKGHPHAGKKKQQQKKQQQHHLCFNLKVTLGKSDQEVDLRQVGLDRTARPQQEKAILVVYTRSRKRENLFNEMKEKIKSRANSSSSGGSKEEEEDEVDRDLRSKARRRRRTALSSSRHGKRHGKKSQVQVQQEAAARQLQGAGLGRLDHRAAGLRGVPLRGRVRLPAALAPGAPPTTPSSRP
ncbi:Growth/differentiation factor 6-A [Merluccius polli]|uniref:Growth/differentiation factor 6-A n=1 Tax=Merluccius polli TaxID=89951 RepID=A0AA47LZ37_MERPO|nr:Growth/differentiation factor 6-A [Merluccius polli]